MKSVASILIMFTLLFTSHVHAGTGFSHWVGIFPHGQPFNCLDTYGNASEACVQDCQCGFCNSTSSCLNVNENRNCTNDQWNYADECVQREKENKISSERTGKIAAIIFGSSVATVFLAVSGFYLYPRCQTRLRQREYTSISGHESTSL